MIIYLFIYLFISSCSRTIAPKSRRQIKKIRNSAGDNEDARIIRHATD